MGKILVFGHKSPDTDSVTSAIVMENLEKELIRRNIPCYEIVLAQALHETGNFKSRIICGCSLLVLAIFSILICISGNSPDYLIFPFFMLPFFVITSIIFIFYDLIKIEKAGQACEGLRGGTGGFTGTLS